MRSWVCTRAGSGRIALCFTDRWACNKIQGQSLAGDRDILTHFKPAIVEMFQVRASNFESDGRAMAQDLGFFPKRMRDCLFGARVVDSRRRPGNPPRSA
jgi:hypothetical protein